MSLKFEKNRSVSIAYSCAPLKYTGIISSKNKDKELVLIDDFGKHYVAAWRNNKVNKVGRTFLLKKTNNGFILKDKEYKQTHSGWVW